MRTFKMLMLLWIFDSVLLQGSEYKRNESITLSAPSGISTNVTPTNRVLDVNTDDFLTIPPPTEEKSAVTVVALGVISFIIILVVVVIILVAVVSLRFRCRHCKDAEDKPKPQHPMVSYRINQNETQTYSCSTASTTDGSADKNAIMLVSMKNLNSNNSKNTDLIKAMVKHEEQ